MTSKSSNVHALIMKPRIIFSPCKTADGAKGKEHYGQGQRVYGKVDVAARKAKRVVPIGKIAKGAKELVPIGKTSKGAKGMRQLPVERQTFLKINGGDFTTKNSSIFPLSKTAKGAKGMRHLPVTSQSLLQSNGHH